MLRDRAGFFFTFFFPLIMALFFGVMFFGEGGGSGNAKLRIVVVDEDRTAGSAAFVERLRAASDLDVLPAATREEAFDMVRRNAEDRTAYVVLPPGFGAAREQVFSGRSTTILLGVDPSRQGGGRHARGSADAVRVRADARRDVGSGAHARANAPIARVARRRQHDALGDARAPPHVPRQRRRVLRGTLATTRARTPTAPTRERDGNPCESRRARCESNREGRNRRSRSPFHKGSCGR